MLRTKSTPHPWVIRVIGALAATAVSVSAPRADAGGLLIADGGFGGSLEIAQHDVRVTINNGVAVTEVEQTFRNLENRIVEALYTFPVPKGASVANFSMWINGKEMVGEVVEKKRAREIYESYKRTNVDPGLLEQVDYKTFEMRIFPIAARAEQRVLVTYYQELDVDHDWATYVYPLATTTRQDVDTRVSGRFSLSMEVKSEVPIVEMTSPSHADDVVFVGRTTSYWQGSLEATGADLDRDLVFAYHLERPVTGCDLITSRSGGEDGYLQMTLTVGKELDTLNESMDYVFVSDISGSMANDGKLNLSRQSIEAFVAALAPEDRFDMLAFNVQAIPLFGKLSVASVVQLGLAKAFLAEQRAKGGTRLQPAVEAAYRYKDADRTLNVVILSDGMTEQGEQQLLMQLIRGRPAGVRVFCIGVGNDVNRPLLNQIATSAGGLAAFLSPGDDLVRQAKAFRRKLVRPAATEVKVEFARGGVYDVEPLVMPSLYHGTPIRVYARYRDAGSAKVTVTANIQGHEIVQAFDVELPKQDDRNPEIERMWAWHRVARLMDEDRDADTSKNTEEIVRLCEGYSIVSEHASFLVLENDDEYRRWKIERKNVTRIARDRSAREALRTRLASLRVQSEGQVGASAPVPADVALAPTTPPMSPQSSPARRTQAPPPAPKKQNNRDFNLPKSGGGALDPLSGLLALGMGLLIMLRRKGA